MPHGGYHGYMGSSKPKPFVSKPSAPPGEKGGGGYVTPLVSMPTASRAPPGEKGGGGYVAPSKFVDRQKKTREVQTDEKKKTEFVDRQKKTREAQKKETTKKVEDETPIDSGEYLKEWWKKRLQKKEQLLPVEKPKIRIAEFNLDKFNTRIGLVDVKKNDRRNNCNFLKNTAEKDYEEPKKNSRIIILGYMMEFQKIIF